MSKVEANTKNPVLDMAVISSHDALAFARKDLLAQLDLSQLSNQSKLYAAAQDPIGGNMAVGYTLYASSIVYRTDLVEINSWADLLDEKLAGNVARPNITGTQGPLTLMMLNKAAGNEGTDFTGGTSRVLLRTEAGNATVRLAGFEKRKSAEMSSGQQQRLALARSLVMEPKVLLLDEPLSNLDARLRLKMRTGLQRVQKKTGVTMVFVTRDQVEALGPQTGSF